MCVRACDFTATGSLSLSLCLCSQEGKIDNKTYPAPNRRQRQRPSWQNTDSLQYETEREKRNGFLRRRGRGLVDSASILSAKTHEEIVVIVGGQGFYFDKLGFRIQIDSEAALSKVGLLGWHVERCTLGREREREDD